MVALSQTSLVQAKAFRLGMLGLALTLFVVLDDLCGFRHLCIILNGEISIVACAIIGESWYRHITLYSVHYLSGGTHDDEAFVSINDS